MMLKPLSNNHWTLEDYKERITTEQWKQILLNNDDKIIFKGHARQIQAKNLGYGVVEVSKVPLKSG